MSTTDPTIPAGQALTFAAPKGGVAWRLRNTTHGLLIETDDVVSMEPEGATPAGAQGFRPLLRIQPDQVQVRGDLAVDGSIDRAFDPHKFVGRWRVIRGEAPGNKDIAVIERLIDGRFRLTYERADRERPVPAFEYFLRFNPRTSTLDNDDASNPGHPDRCISFWDGRARGGDGKHRIFAMRSGKGHAEDPLRNLPFENDDGTWGAEGG